MTYNEAMKTADKHEWDKSVGAEHEKFKRHKVWRPVKKSQVPDGAKILTSTWAMKPKANGVKRARLTTQGFEQEEGVHYYSHDLSAPVVHISLC
eukprot:13859875-Ditylum_brightwellii.AAC.1